LRVHAVQHTMEGFSAGTAALFAGRRRAFFHASAALSQSCKARWVWTANLARPEPKTK
jgi:hypothetical protein